MSWKDKIEGLKEKFWNAETTLEEERLLRNHYLTVDDSDIEALYFQFIEEEKSVAFHTSKRKGTVYLFKKYIPAIAASLLLVLASVLVFNNFQQSQKPQVFIAETPEEALLVTQVALGAINDHITTSESMIKNNLNQFDKIFSSIKNL